MKEFDIIKKYLPRVLCAAMSLTIVCSTVGVTAYSAGAESSAPKNSAQTADAAKKTDTKKTEKTEDAKKFSKEETVYVIAGADGTPKKVIVSGWIKNNKKEKTITDKSNLTDLENVKGDETYTIDENKMVQWDAGGEDIFYKGNSGEQLPVGVTIKYELDGNAVDPSQLAGKSGKLKMTFNYTNRQYKEVKVNGKKEKIYVPFIMMTGMMLDSEKFSDVTVSNGKVINDGTHTFVAGFALPGMQDTLAIDKDKLELPSSVEITADVKDFEVATTLTIATNDMFGDIDTDKIDEKTEELESKIDELSDGVDQLCEGSSQLYTGLGTLLDKSGELIDGVSALYTGSEQLKNGAAQLNGGAGELSKGASALDSGVGTLSSGAAQLDGGAGGLVTGAARLDSGAGSLSSGAAEVDSGVAQLQGYIGTLAGGLTQISSNSAQLNGGAKQVFETLLSTADTQIAAAGLSAEPLTIENYGKILDGLTAQLSDESVQKLAYDTAYKTVSAAVESQREVVRQAVEAEVKKQVTNGVLAAAGLGLDADSYEQAVAAGQIPEEVQTQVAAGITSQMAGMTGVIDSKTEEQISALIESNMQGEEVQSQISAAVAKAQAGRQSLSALKTQLDSYNTFYQGVLQYTAGVDEANAGAQQILGGTSQLKSGTSALKDGAYELKSGTSELSSGAAELKSGTSTLNSGAKELKNGTSQLKSGAVTLKDGAGSLYSGSEELFAGIAALKKGSGALVDGVKALQEGSMQLSEGMEKLRKEGIQTIKDAVDGDLKNLTERFKAMVQVSKGYTSFSGNTNDEDGKVDFIFKTDAIEKEDKEEE